MFFKKSQIHRDTKYEFRVQSKDVTPVASEGFLEFWIYACGVSMVQKSRSDGNAVE